LYCSRLAAQHSTVPKPQQLAAVITAVSHLPTSEVQNEEPIFLVFASRGVLFEFFTPLSLLYGLTHHHSRLFPPTTSSIRIQDSGLISLSFQQ
jgi:hypothetical protein